MEKEAAEFEEAAEIRESPEPIERAPRRGATLEGRVRAMLERRGFRATTNRIVLDHEFDVWAEDRDGRVIVAECKEYYGSGPATSAHIRNFFGKVYDVEKNFGAIDYLPNEEKFVVRGPAGRTRTERVESIFKQFFNREIELHFGT